MFAKINLFVSLVSPEMAYKRYRRFGAKRTRKYFKGRGRRYYRRRRFFYNKRRRALRRFPKATEAKLVEFHHAYNWTFDQNLDNDNVQFSPGACFIIPFANLGIDIEGGYAVNKRIGAKVKPIKLRISGVITFDRKFTLAEPIIPESFQIRLLVYQVRGGNGTKAPNTADYHPLAMVTTTGLLDGIQLKKLFNYYDATNSNPITFSATQMKNNMGTGKTPLRLGIGGQFKMLYTKTYTVSSSTRASVPFRIVTKVPNRLVWPEAPSGQTGAETTTYCRNCIYAVWVVIPQTPNPIGSIYLADHAQLFYIDK